MCEYPESDVNEIIPNLWLGNYKAAYSKEFLDNYNIKNIITIMDTFDNRYKYNNINYLCFPLKDEDTCILDDIFEKTNEFIYNVLKNNEKVLVHCKKGHHRSASIIAAFLMKYLEVDYMAAILYINHLRPCALRRDTCMTNNLFKYHLKLNNIKHCNRVCKSCNNIFYCQCSL